MVNNKISAKTVMLEHSKAKVELYRQYLATYLHIISRTHVQKIYLYDLFCGEGIYENQEKGSPVVTLETLKNNFYSNNKSCPNIEIWFNDNGISDIEPSKHRIDRVKEFCSGIFNHQNLKINYTQKDYAEIYPDVVKKVKSLQNSEKALLFIDPYDYKTVKPEHIKTLLLNGNSEVILFMPISNMYRIANKVGKGEVFPGSKPLEEFLNLLFNNTIPYFETIDKFIDAIRNQFRVYMNISHTMYVDTFTLQRDDTNVYCLFFFSSHIRGFEKMLETKWKLDEKSGKGFKLNTNNTGSLFAVTETSGYETELQHFLQNKKTNEEIYKFGLNHGHLPKQTNEILKKWQNNGKLNVYDKNASPVRKGAFYLGYEYHIGLKQDKTIIYIQLK